MHVMDHGLVQQFSPLPLYYFGNTS